MNTTRSPAVLFDVDGTLVDSNYLHVHAWQRAFDAEGLTVEAWRIHRCIGMDGSTLVHTMAGNAGEGVGEHLMDLHTHYYREIAPLLRPLPGAQDLLHKVAELGLQVVLATSAPEDELVILREVLGCDDVISEVTSSGDVETAQPEPDIVEVALHRAHVTAQRAVFVGDAVWDAEACARAQVPSIGLLSGGVSRDELENAGATEVFENPLELLAQLEHSRIAALTGCDNSDGLSGRSCHRITSGTTTQNNANAASAHAPARIATFRSPRRRTPRSSRRPARCRAAAVPHRRTDVPRRPEI